MATFDGTNASEFITPGNMSPSVVSSGASAPTADSDEIHAGGGNDVVEGDGGDDLVDLGAGQDVFTWNPGDGSDSVEGGADTDLLLFNGSGASELVEIGGNGPRMRFARSVGSVLMDLNSIEFIEYAAFDGADTIEVSDLADAGVKQVKIDLAGINPGGDGETDEVRFQGAEGGVNINLSDSNGDVLIESGLFDLRIAGAEAADKVGIAGGGGGDFIDALGLDAGLVLLTIDGGAGNDTLIGGAGRDLLLGGGGEDYVRSLAGDDDAALGSDDDTYAWAIGDGNDVVDGGGGLDRLFCGATVNSDTIEIFAIGGDVSVARTADGATVEGDQVERIECELLNGADSIVIGDLSATDVEQVLLDLAGAAAAGDGALDQVRVNGSSAGQTFSLAVVAGAVAVDVASQAIVIKTAEAADRLTIHGFGGADIFDASELVDPIMQIAFDGGSGEDLFRGGQAAEALTGGLDGDTVSYLASTAAVSAHLNTGAGFGGFAHGDSYAGIENLSGSAYADILAGNASGNFLRGGLGDDQLYGGNGADRLIGGAGADIAHGGDGNDTYVVDDEADMVHEGVGEGDLDRVLASVSYALEAGAQVERLMTDAKTAAIAINLVGNELANQISGNAGANLLGGGAGDDRLFGHAGDDLLIGGGGVDGSNGGLGDDRYVVDHALDLVVEKAGEGAADRVQASVDYKLIVGAEVEFLTTTDAAGAEPIDLTGSGFANRVIGNAGQNLLRGAGGDDVLIGSAGADTLVGGAGGDTSDGGLGDDFHYVNNAADVVVERAGEGRDRVLASADYVLGAAARVELLTTDAIGGAAQIDLTGNGFANTVVGNAGDNRIGGGGGNDMLRGLGGLDSFVFDTMLGAGNVDAILDFNSVDDVIELDAGVFTGLGPLSPEGFAFGATATEADDRILYDMEKGILRFDADGVGGAAAVAFATLQPGLTDLSSADFLVVG